jgi:glutathione peroxidase-family protein
LAVLAFPCNQFGSQEPGTEAEIKAFAAGQGATFDMFAKVEVNGAGAAPVWAWLKEQQGGLLGSGIKWNFTKFVVDQEGRAVARFGPMDDPIPKVQKAVVELLLK